jgi:hypothetical protein
MSTADGEHHDRNRDDPKQVREPSGTARDAIDEFGVELESTNAALERVHRTRAVGLRETMARLDQFAAQVDEAMRLTKVLVARRPEPTR